MGQEISQELLDVDVPARTLKDRTVSSVAEYVKSGSAKRIVVLTGAGISTSAGIPDFRSPDTGLYSNLARLDLPYPEAVFDISFFRQNPKPFYTLAQELYPGKYMPTVAHAFIALLAKKNLLHMLFTQNIDCLERMAGVPSEKVIEAHGSFATQRCIECKKEFPDDLMKEFVKRGDIPHCPECDGLVKPDIVFFGEALPERFHSHNHVPGQADLMIIIGTSLSVHPFAALPDYAMEGVPRVLLNMERVGSLGSRPDDVLVLGDCDGAVRKLADELGWLDELEDLYRQVGGEPATKAPPTLQTKHEILEDEIEKLTSEVDHALKISNGHKNWLEKHLTEKSAAGPPSEPDSTPKGLSDAEISKIVAQSWDREDAGTEQISAPETWSRERSDDQALESQPIDLEPTSSPEREMVANFQAAHPGPLDDFGSKYSPNPAATTEAPLEIPAKTVPEDSTSSSEPKI